MFTFSPEVHKGTLQAPIIHPEASSRQCTPRHPLCNRCPATNTEWDTEEGEGATPLGISSEGGTPGVDHTHPRETIPEDGVDNPRIMGRKLTSVSTTNTQWWRTHGNISWHRHLGPKSPRHNVLKETDTKKIDEEEAEKTLANDLLSLQPSCLGPLSLYENQSEAWVRNSQVQWTASWGCQ